MWLSSACVPGVVLVVEGCEVPGEVVDERVASMMRPLMSLRLVAALIVLYRSRFAVVSSFLCSW